MPNAETWAKKVYKETVAYHHGKEDVNRALKFVVNGKRDDAEAEREAAHHERLKAKNDRELGAVGLAKLREEHADYLDEQAAALEERAKALETLAKKSKK
jgi:hypothetical protein